MTNPQEGTPTMTNDQHWRDQAACRGATPTNFYPEDRANIRPEVRDLCAECPVHHECLDYALHHEKHGYFAGTSARDRQAMRTRLDITLTTPGPILRNPIDELDDGTRTATEIAEALGVTPGAIGQRRHRAKAAA